MSWGNAYLSTAIAVIVAAAQLLAALTNPASPFLDQTGTAKVVIYEAFVESNNCFNVRAASAGNHSCTEFCRCGAIFLAASVDVITGYTSNSTRSF